MNRYTTEQYAQAIEALRLGSTQLQPDGNGCAICGDSGHQAFECGHNPLVAMSMCRAISEQADTLHESLHSLAGHVQHMGMQVGPARIIPPTP